MTNPKFLYPTLTNRRTIVTHRTYKEFNHALVRSGYRRGVTMYVYAEYILADNKLLRCM